MHAKQGVVLMDVTEVPVDGNVGAIECTRSDAECC